MTNGNDSTPGDAKASTKANPSSGAQTVAIALEEQGTAAPKVVASGRGLVAEQILELAFANGVRVREDADLAQILAAVDVDSDIPTEAFAAVAEVLAYLYRANGDMDPPPFTGDVESPASGS